VKPDFEISIDSPATFVTRNEAIQSKQFLRQIYREWSQMTVDACSRGGVSIEVGATNSVSREILRGMTCWGTDVVALPGFDIVTDACSLALRDESVRNIIAIDTLHHLLDAGRFLEASERALCAGGRLVMVEPWNNRWARFIYSKFHPEPFDERAGWTVSGDGPMTRANGALPGIVFERDRAHFESRFPQLKILCIKQATPIAFCFPEEAVHGLACLGRPID